MTLSDPNVHTKDHSTITRASILSWKVADHHFDPVVIEAFTALESEFSNIPANEWMRPAEIE